MPWGAIRFTRRFGHVLEIGRFDPDALRVDAIALPCADVATAIAGYEAIEQARARPQDPFRGVPALLGTSETNG